MIFLFDDLIKISEFGEKLNLITKMKIEEKIKNVRKKVKGMGGCMHSPFHPFTIPLSSIFSLYTSLYSIFRVLNNT